VSLDDPRINVASARLMLAGFAAVAMGATLLRARLRA
jgi:hypothetical protein